MIARVRQLDTTELAQRVERMYEEIALDPDRECHVTSISLQARKA